MATVLVVDDERAIRQTLKEILRRQGYRVLEADGVARALAILREEDPPEAALVDLLLPDGEGTTVLEHITRNQAPTAVVMISGHGSIRTAVDAVRNGAFDFVEKPLDRERLLITLRNAVRQSELLRRPPPGEETDFPTASPKISALLKEAGRIAASPVPVLIVGETGAGKEILARWIHGHGLRPSGPFVPLNCAALPEHLAESELFGHVKGAFTGAETTRKGKFLSAHGGSLFLDEIGDLPLPLQAKLLRVLEEGVVEAVGSDKAVPVTVRIIAATHRDLAAKAEEGSFRRDLLFRISGFPLRLPPLRERPEDIPFLAQRFLDEARARQGWPLSAMAPGFLAALKERSWPGNVRELRWAVERAALLAGPDLPGPGRLLPEAAPQGNASPTGSLEEARQSAEAKAIREALSETGGNVAAAARRLTMSRSRLYEKLESLGLDPAEFRKPKSP